MTSADLGFKYENVSASAVRNDKLLVTGPQTNGFYLFEKNSGVGSRRTRAALAYGPQTGLFPITPV